MVVSRPEGQVVAENRAARTSLGHPNGKPCWQQVGEMEDVKGLPCHEGCTTRLMQRARDTTAHVTWRGDPYQLSCVPVNGKVVSVLAPCPGPPGDAGEELTARERDVLRLLAEGMNSARIAEELGIGTGTVRTHVEHLREKLEVPTRAAIVGRAFRLGYLR